MRKSLLSGSTFFLLAAFGAGAATLSGVVRTGGTGGAGGGTAVADAKVVLMGFGGGGGGIQQRLDSTVTNAQGQYSFDSVATGFKQVVVSKTGFENGQGFANILQNSGEYTANVTLVASGGGGGGDVGMVAGTVRSGSATGPAVANATLILTRAAGGGGAAYADTATSNAQGQYRFENVPALNNYTLRVTASGFNAATNANVDVSADETTTANFTLTAAAQPGSVSGTVRKAADSEPVSGATVIMTRTAIGGGGAFRDSTKTNADGHYAFDSVAANTNYIITVSAAGFQNAVNSDVDVASNQTATVDFRLIASGPSTSRGSIIGTVVDNAKKAVAKARVILSRTGTGGGAGAIDTVETDASGDFSFDSVAALQNYTVTVTATGYQTAVNSNVDVVAGQAVLADFILVPGGVGIRAFAAAPGSLRTSTAHGALTVEFAASPWAGRISVYDLRGGLAFASTVPAGASRISLPGKTAFRLLVLERGGMVEKLSLRPVR